MNYIIMSNGIIYFQFIKITSGGYSHFPYFQQNQNLPLFVLINFMTDKNIIAKYTLDFSLQ